MSDRENKNSKNRPETKSIASADKTAFERVQMARHPERPYALDLIGALLSDFLEIHGDRRYADDSALVGGFARLGDLEIAVIGQQKGRDTNERRHRNFAMAKPEGYRKALRIMKTAEKFRRPLLTIVDTPGAYPGIDAEERGQAEAIALNLREMAALKIPVIAVVLGEGGSGGALGIAVADRVLMLENAVYSVITPEGCAAILWKDAQLAAQAADNLKLTAQNLIKSGLIDEIISEPENWNAAQAAEAFEQHTEYMDVYKNLRENLEESFKTLMAENFNSLYKKRFAKFRAMGSYEISK